MPAINVTLTDEELEYLKKFKREGEDWKRFIMSSLWLKGCLIRKPRNEFGENWEIDPPIKIEKPCYSTGYCPYGQIVEAFHIDAGPYTEFSCKLFGHDCPAFYCSEPFTEKMKTHSEIEEDHPEPLQES